MRPEVILEVLGAHYEVLAERFGVCALGLFGSAARGEARPDSDVDILVDFVSPPGFDGYMALKWHLEELLASRVDLVMRGALRGPAREIVESELLRVA